MPENLEIKVACTDDQFDAIQHRLSERLISPIAHLTQIDTYFRVPKGRLKLREIGSADGNSAEIIQYCRPDRVGDRVSTYQRLPVTSDQAVVLKSSLEMALGELVTVRKHRCVAIWRSTRIHLDEVDGLGKFVELETVLGSSDQRVIEGRTEFGEVVEWLGLASLESIPGSYSDLLIRRKQLA